MIRHTVLPLVLLTTAGMVAPALSGHRPAPLPVWNSSQHLQIMMYYGMGEFNLEQMTKGKEGGDAGRVPWVTHMLEGRFSDQVQIYRKYNISSFYGDMSSRYEVPEAADNIFLRGKNCKVSLVSPVPGVCRISCDGLRFHALFAARELPRVSSWSAVGKHIGHVD